MAARGIPANGMSGWSIRIRKLRPFPRRSRTVWLGAGAAIGGSVGFGAAVLLNLSAGLTQPVATFLAGAGALSAGILAYTNGQRSREQSELHHQADMERERERHDADTRRARESTLRDRYTAVTAQIAHDSAAIRQAGVYALTALADDWHAFGQDEERQVCINLLQWYLRVPFPDASSAADLPEREIRQTIVGIITERRRRRPEDPKSWATGVFTLKQASLPNCDLRIDLSGTNLTGADLTNANLSNTKLAGVSLTRACLTGANLSFVNLNSEDLAFANMTGANMIYADLAGARLTGVDMTGADLHFANLTDATLHNANLSESNLSDAKLTRAILSHARLTGSDMSGTNLANTDLTSVDMTGTNLADADLTGATMTHADLTNTDLTGATMTHANLVGANLTGAGLTGADLTDVITSNSTVWPAGFTPPV
ncbi:pentapeptide repeat-containing protein [Nocardia colli]|uniref:Pentapeptide repeat-containing protein n=1 Tax=Nocardia colli TaxID=2545717 RepID=A0A5N0E9B9_9NOCA|nr:pentapeptide repeat-containing protein [Nocardia colli]KAA8884764.1 pentapeptide repeat-containing protein [Nocardia colli]